MANLPFRLFVTSVESEGPLLKLWGQSDQTSVVFIERYLLQLAADFEAGRYVPNIASLKVGQLCVGKYSDMNYYRAKILDLNQVRKGFIRVHFIDHGNTESLSLTEIRVVDGPTPLASFRPLAHQYIVSGIAHPTGAWNPAMFDWLTEHICNYEVNAVVITEVGDFKIVEVDYKQMDLSKYLIDTQFAVPCSISTQLQILSPTTLPKFPQARPITPTLTPEPSPPVVFRHTILPIHSEHIVTISGIEDGPKSFTVHLQAWEKHLEKLMMELNNIEILPLHELPVPGTLCVARYNQALSRAVITQVIDDKCKIYFVDYGQNQTIPYVELFQLPPKFVLHKILAMRFSLTNLKSLTITPQFKNAFRDLTMGKTLRLRVAPPEGPPVLQYCELFDNRHNVLSILKSHLALEMLRFKEMEQDIECIADVEVPYVKNYQEFYINYVSEIDALHRLMDDIAAHCESALNVGSFKVGMAVCALFHDDGQWYRAEITQIEPLEVRYVDFGNMAKVQPSDIKAITSELVNRLPKQAICCCLNNFESKPIDLEMSNKFKELTLENIFTMKIIRFFKPNVLLVDLIDVETREMISKKLGVEEPVQTSKFQFRQETPPRFRKDNKTSPERFNRGNTDPIIKRTYHENSRSLTPDSPKRQHNRNDYKRNDSSEEDTNRYNRNDFKRNNRNSNEDTNNRFNKNDFKRPNSYNEDSSNRFNRNDSKRNDNNRFNRNDRNSNEESWRDKRKDSQPKERIRSDSENSWRDNNRSSAKDKWNSSPPKETRSTAKDKWNSSPPKETQPWRESKRNDSTYPPRDRKDTFDRKPRRNSNRSDNSTDRKPYKSPQRAPEYADFSAKFTELDFPEGAIETINVSWFYNPKHFYIQITSNETEFKKMMVEIQKAYRKRPPASSIIPIGSAVIAHFNEDNFLYRAVVIDVRLTKYKVRYIDYGNTNFVDKSKIWQIEKQFMELPIQSLVCTLPEIYSPGETWCQSTEMDNCFDKKGYQCVFQGFEEDKRCVSLSYNGQLVVEELINKGLASRTPVVGVESDHVDQHIPGIEHNLEDSSIDLGLLPEQTLRIYISAICGLDRFYVYLDQSKANSVRQEIQNIASQLNLEQLPTELVVNGTNCLIKTDDIWQRCIIINAAATTGVYIEFPDVGGGKEVPVEELFVLPIELTNYYYQSHEAGINNFVLGTLQNLTDEQFQAKYENNEVLAYVHDVVNSKLMLTLYDLEGNLIDLIKTDDSEVFKKITPICPLPVLSPNVMVWVTHINSVDSLYVQRSGDELIINQLVDDITNFYSNSENRVVIEPEEDGLCVAKSQDGNYYRAKVIDPNTVIFIDYGNQESVNEIYKLDPKFFTPHELALHVALPITSTAEDIVTQLNTFTNGQNFLAKLGFTEGCWYIELYHQNIPLTQYLIDTNLATYLDFDPFKRRVASPPPDDRIMIYVTHVDSPNQFYAQLANEEDSIAQLQEEIQAIIPQAEDLDSPETGVLCAAKYSADDVWYRAEVLDSHESITTVRFIDYGNTDVLDNGMGVMKTLPPHMLSINRYAKKCSLDLIPIGEEWSQTASELFEKKIITQVVQANILHEREGVLYLNVVVNDENLGESLLIEGYGKTVDRDVGLSDLTGFVSHINSIEEFWIQLESSCNDLEMVSDQLSLAPQFPDLIETKPGVLCAARFPEDNEWYRARILTLEPLEVLFVDYGNSSVVTELKMLPEQVVNLRALAVKCTLQLNGYPEDATEKFKKIAADGATVFHVKVLATGEKSTVELSINGFNVIEQILESNMLAVISHLDSPTSFWMQSQLDLNKLDEIGSQIAEIDSPACQGEDKIYLAMFEDLYYRSKVESKNEEGYFVRFIDYGNAEVVPEVRECPAKLADIAPLAQHCSLKLPEGVTEWPVNATTTFITLSNEGETVFEVRVLEASNPNIVELTTDGKDVATLLTTLEPIPEETDLENNQIETTETITNIRTARIIEDSVQSTEQKLLENNQTEFITNIPADEIIQDSDPIAEEVLDNKDNSKELITEEEIVEPSNEIEMVEKTGEIDSDISESNLENPITEKIEENIPDSVDEKSESPEELTETVTSQTEEKPKTEEEDILKSEEVITSDEVEDIQKTEEVITSGEVKDIQKSEEVITSGEVENTMKSEEVVTSDEVENTVKAEEVMIPGEVENTLKSEEVITSGEVDALKTEEEITTGEVETRISSDEKINEAVAETDTLDVDVSEAENEYATADSDIATDGEAALRIENSATVGKPNKKGKKSKKK